MVLCEPDGAEVNAENGENGGGVDAETGPLALLFCVIDDNKAGPGMSEIVSHYLCLIVGFRLTRIGSES